MSRCGCMVRVSRRARILMANHLVRGLGVGATCSGNAVFLRLLHLQARMGLICHNPPCALTCSITPCRPIWRSLEPMTTVGRKRWQWTYRVQHSFSPHITSSLRIPGHLLCHSVDAAGSGRISGESASKSFRGWTHGPSWYASGSTRGMGDEAG